MNSDGSEVNPIFEIKGSCLCVWVGPKKPQEKRRFTDRSKSAEIDDC